MKSALFVVAICLLVSAGCSDAPEPQSQRTESSPVGQPPAERSTLQTVVGGLTGQTAVERGKEARTKIQAAASNKNSSLNEVLR